MFLDEGHHPSLENNLNAFVYQARRRMEYQDSRMANLEANFSYLETTCANMSSTLKTLETLVGQPTYAMNEISSRPLMSDIEDDDMWECEIVTFSFEEELPGSTLVEKDENELTIKKAANAS